MERKNKWWISNVPDDLRHALISINARVGNSKIERDWTNDLILNYEDLDKDMEEIPSILSFWSAVLAEARKNQKILEMKMDIKKSRIITKIKEQVKIDNIKLTVGDKDDLINLDDSYTELRIQSIDMEATVSKLFGIVEALRTKSENMRSFSAMKRAELHNT
jgi:hypothetical protein